MQKGIDFEMLAESFELSGANIKSVLYSAAYIAGAENQKVGPSHIARALKYEYDLPFRPKVDFPWQIA